MTLVTRRALKLWLQTVGTGLYYTATSKQARGKRTIETAGRISQSAVKTAKNFKQTQF